ncbi:MAG: hypothetical protein LBR65_07770 [Culturomica sp.]|jgi:hypothetical protein|nr:hypothetical protein [Culturomica sp.]
MKHKPYVLFLLCIFLFIRCEREEIAVPPSRSPESLAEWYETNYPQALRLKIEEEYVGSAMTPHWESARFAGNGHLRSMEAEMLSDGLLVYHPDWKEKADMPAVRNTSYPSAYSFTRLIILANEEIGEQICFLMTVVPTAEYYARHPDFHEDFSYFDKPAEYNGLVLYHNMEGELVNGWEYEAGRITERITPAEGPTTRAFTCSTDYIWVDVYSCWVITTGFGKEANSISECDIFTKLVEISMCQVTEESTGGGYDNDPWRGRGGGGGSNDRTNNSTQNNSRSKKITQKLSLNFADSVKLEEALEELTQECAFTQILNYFNSIGFKLEDIVVDEKLRLGNASFTPDNKLKFWGSEDINAENLMHELTHAYQYHYHQQNGNNYALGGVETGTMEFEVRLLADLIAYQKDPDMMRNEWACRVYNGGVYEIEEDYEKWLKSLLGTQNTFPSTIDMSKFHQFDSLFRKSYPYTQVYELGVEYKPSIPDLFKTINEKCLK